MAYESLELITVPPDAIVRYYGNKAELNRIKECYEKEGIAYILGIDAATGYPVLKEKESGIYYISNYTSSNTPPVWIGDAKGNGYADECLREKRRLDEIRTDFKLTKEPPVSIGSLADAALLTFEPYGPWEISGSWKFNRGWIFGTPADTAISDIVAVSKGNLYFHPSNGALPNTIAIRISKEENRLCSYAGMPGWFPGPRWIAYHGIDVDETKKALLQLLKGNPERLASILESYNRHNETEPCTSTEAILAVFFNQTVWALPEGIPVSAGEAIGKGALTTDPQRRSFELRFTQRWPASVHTENPAFYFTMWSELNLLHLPGILLTTRWLRLDQGIQSNGTMRFVSGTLGKDENTPFIDPKKPAKTLGKAISEAIDGDTIIILDGGIYKENELEVAKALNITSSGWLADHQVHLGGNTDPAPSGYGCRPANGTRPVVPAGLPILQGPEEYLKIKDDMSEDHECFPSKNAHRVLRFQVPPSSGIASLTKVVVRYGGAREGGGIGILAGSRVAVASCHVYKNIAYFNPLSFLTKNNEYHLPEHGGLPHPFEGSGWFQEGFGGGIFINRSSPIIWGNLLERNLALSGGAIGVFAYSYPLIAQNHISKNAGPDWFKSVSMHIYLIFENIKSVYTPSDGGAIRILTASLRFDDAKELEREVKKRYPVASPENPIVIDPKLMYDGEGLRIARGEWIHIHGNHILDSFTNDDGGGVYATGVSRVFSVRNYISGNMARCGDGGGYRISTGSALLSIGDEIVNNRVDGKVKDGATGGGIAVRCGDCALFGVHISKNQSNFAGAGIGFTATRERDVTGVEWLANQGYKVPSWDRQRREALGFDHSHLIIDGKSCIESNTAKDTERGKGGGIFVLRFADRKAKPSFIGDKLTIRIDNCQRVLKNSNKSAFQDEGSTKTTYHRICLQDLTKIGIKKGSVYVISDGDLDTELAKGPDFQYDSHTP